MKEELLQGLTEEQIAKVKACKNQEEILAVSKKEGIELTEEQLAAVNGGCGTSTVVPCPRCKSTNVYYCGQNLCYEKSINVTSAIIGFGGNNDKRRIVTGLNR